MTKLDEIAPFFFFNCRLFFICFPCPKHFGWTCGAILKYHNFDPFYPQLAFFGIFWGHPYVPDFLLGWWRIPSAQCNFQFLCANGDMHPLCAFAQPPSGGDGQCTIRRDVLEDPSGDLYKTCRQVFKCTVCIIIRCVIGPTCQIIK